jgi:hypothetical protein
MMRIVIEGHAEITNWLVAIGGLGAFAATTVLAWLGFRQMGALQTQATAATSQVEVMRAVAASDAQSVAAQIDAMVDQGEAVREAARAQLQPIVLAYSEGIPWIEPGETSLTTYRYVLQNEGVGPALIVQHGLDFGDSV